MTYTESTPRVYVGTYAKYSNGDLAGAWLDLSDYADWSDFYEAATKLHSDEADPELMFQDWEGIPENMISESSISEEVWEWLELDEEEKEILAAYQDAVDQEGTLNEAQNAFAGAFDDVEDFIWDLLRSFGEEPDPRTIIGAGFDPERAWDQLLRHEYSHSDRRDGQLYFFHQG
jgi:antirestriction protein